MKVRFKIVGKCPGSRTKYQLGGLLKNPTSKTTSVANSFKDLFDTAIREEWHEIPGGAQPKVTQIILTFTLP